MGLCQASDVHNGVTRARHTEDDIMGETYGRLVTFAYNETTGQEEIRSCLYYCGAVSGASCFDDCAR